MDFITEKGKIQDEEEYNQALEDACDEFMRYPFDSYNSQQICEILKKMKK